MPTAIVCGSGGYRTVFIQGVLSVFEEANFRADAYAGTSASGMVAAAAAVGQSNAIGLDYWRASIDLKHQPGNGMSEVMFEIIREWGPPVREKLFQSGVARFFLPASRVISDEAVIATQGKNARRLGRQLILAAAKGDASWAEQNLELHLFDTQGEGHLRLTANNFDEVCYASTRMMHAWDIPATIGGLPYVDASYRCACPAVEVAALGYNEVIAIYADPTPLYRDVFRSRIVPDEPPYILIHPEIDPAELGADFTEATYDGLHRVYEMGREKGAAYLKTRLL